VDLDVHLRQRVVGAAVGRRLMPLFRGRRLSFTKKTAGASPSRVTPEHAAALADPVMQTMRAQLFREEALRAPGDKTYEVPMPRSYDDFVRQASQRRAPSFDTRGAGEADPPPVGLRPLLGGSPPPTSASSVRDL
jgi:hypothetical protein